MNSEAYKKIVPDFLFGGNGNEGKIGKDEEFFEDDFSSLKRVNRIFTNKQKEKCWNRASIILGRDPDRWRYDAAGSPVLKALRGCQGPLCHEYDHIVPFSKGGETTVRNCQILQTYTNKFKSNRTDLNGEHLRKHSIKLKLTEYEMDLIEELIYGNVKKKL
jgi:hypothetical protein